MNLIIFLGSGVSYKSRLPDSKTITDNLINGDWHQHTDSNFYSGKHPNDHFQKDDIAPKIQTFLKYIKEYADSYLIERKTNEANYEDIFFLIKQLHDELSYETDNPAIQLFINHLIEKFDIPNNPDFVELGTRIDFKDFCWKAKDFINCVVWNSLYTSSDPEGFSLLKEVIKCNEFGKVDIATLNHDLLVEKYFELNDIGYCDGFSQPDGDFCYFVPELYNKDSSKIKLFKLHGSINWYRLRDYDNSKNTTTDFYTKVINNDHWHCKNSTGRMLDPLNSYPIFLTGTTNKLSDYNFGIMRRVHLKFDEILQTHEYMIMSGYGWNDKGINGMLMEWIMTSSDRKLILFHENPESIKKSKSAMWHRYDDLIKWGRLIPVNKWMSDAKLEDVLKHLNKPHETRTH